MKTPKRAPRDKGYFERKLKELELKEAIATARENLLKFRSAKK